MRWRGINHVEFSVLDYEKSIAFYDEMFSWLGYKSFWSLDLGYRSTYYMARYPMPHSYIGFQPAKSGEKLNHEARPTGIHHVALWAKNRREINDFYDKFLLPNEINVTEKTTEYPIYSPGYYAVFFDDPLNGIHWELVHFPLIPSLGAYFRWKRALTKAVEQTHPESKDQNDFFDKFMRPLPKRR